MIKQMERRFAIVAISVISLVLLFLVVAVQIISANINIKKADVILSTLATGEMSNTVVGGESDIEQVLDTEEISKKIFSRSEFMGSVDFESIRSFSVILSQNGIEDETQIRGMKFVEEKVAVDMASKAVKDGAGSGFVDDYRYLVVEEEDVISVFFLEYSFEQQAQMILLWVSLGVYALSVLMVGILVKIFIKPVMKPIKESYEKQKQFITDASHELKTPLTIIATDMQLVEMESGSTKWTKSVNRQVERLTTLSNDLVELSRMDEKASQLELKELNLSGLVSDVVYGFEPALITDGKKLEIEIGEEIRVEGDYDAIEKVMSILMENSLKYCDKEGKVRVELVKKNKGAVLSVENTVSYVEQGSHNEYFGRFYRADKSRNSKTGGFGIGLAVAKSIVEQHHWKIEAYSHDNGTIVFTVEIRE